MNFELIIVSVCIVWGFFSSTDLLNFMFRKDPVSHIFNIKLLHLGIFCNIVVVYYILNQYKLF